MREVIITRILYKFDQKTRFFYEGWSWFKFNNLRMALDMALKFYSCVEKRLKLKVQSVEETRRFPPPPRTVELACLEMLNIGFLKIFIYLFTLFKVRIILVLTNKNQPPN